jgi:hypothetical protein
MKDVDKSPITLPYLGQYGADNCERSQSDHKQRNPKHKRGGSKKCATRNPVKPTQ